MGNRSRYVAVTAAAAAALAARRRARRRRGAEVAGVTPLPVEGIAVVADPEADPAHAPGHRHLPPSADERRPEPVHPRPRTKSLHGLRRPFAGS